MINLITEIFKSIGGGYVSVGIIILGIYGATKIEACQAKCLSNFSCIQQCPNLTEYGTWGAILGFLFFLGHSLWKKFRENKSG